MKRRPTDHLYRLSSAEPTKSIVRGLVYLRHEHILWAREYRRVWASKTPFSFLLRLDQFLSRSPQHEEKLLYIFAFSPSALILRVVQENCVVTLQLVPAEGEQSTPPTHHWRERGAARGGPGWACYNFRWRWKSVQWCLDADTDQMMLIQSLGVGGWVIIYREGELRYVLNGTSLPLKCMWCLITSISRRVGYYTRKWCGGKRRLIRKRRWIRWGGGWWYKLPSELLMREVKLFVYICLINCHSCTLLN